MKVVISRRRSPAALLLRPEYDVSMKMQRSQYLKSQAMFLMLTAAFLII